MSVPKLNSKFSDPSFESDRDGFHFRSVFPPWNNELEAVSSGSEPSKKPRFSKYVSNSMIPMDRNDTTTMRNNFKAQLCRKFERGSCNYGGRCRFAHSVQNIRMPVNREHKLCKMFTKQSECIYGDNCRFLHVYSENARESSASVVKFPTMKFEESTTSCSRQLESNRSVYGNFDANTVSSRPVGLKTSQSSAWVRIGNDYGKTCKFVRARAGIINYVDLPSLCPLNLIHSFDYWCIINV